MDLNWIFIFSICVEALRAGSSCSPPTTDQIPLPFLCFKWQHEPIPAPFAHGITNQYCKSNGKPHRMEVLFVVSAVLICFPCSKTSTSQCHTIGEHGEHCKAGSGARDFPQQTTFKPPGHLSCTANSVIKYTFPAGSVRICWAKSQRSFLFW